MEFDNVNVEVRKEQGNIGVARAIYEYMKRGYTVLAPISDSDKYDLVVDDGVRLLKVQVKTTRCKIKDYSGRKVERVGYQVNLSTKGGNTKVNTIRFRQVNDYDVLFVLTELGECWSIPTEALGTAKNQINVGTSKFEKFKL
jgi:hypothetical protein